MLHFALIFHYFFALLSLISADRRGVRGHMRTPAHGKDKGGVGKYAYAGVYNSYLRLYHKLIAGQGKDSHYHEPPLPLRCKLL